MSDAPRAPRIWTSALAFAVYLATVVIGSVVTLVIFLLARAQPGRVDEALTQEAVAALGASLPGILLAGLVSSLAGVGVALAAASLSPQPVLARLRLVPTRRGSLVALAATLAMVGMGALSSAVTRALHFENRGTLPVIREALRGLTPPQMALAVAIIGVSAGVGEELFFRGYLLTRLAARWRPWVGNAVVAGLFALMHLDPVHSSFALLVGLALGWTSLRAKSVLPTLGAHVLNNTMSVVSTSVESGEDDAPLRLLFVAGPVAIAAGLYAVARLTRGTVRGDEHLPT